MFSYKGRTVRVAAIRDLTRQMRAEEEINTLRDMLPICLFCKKVRDDKGYWERVDIYKNILTPISAMVSARSAQKSITRSNLKQL